MSAVAFCIGHHARVPAQMIYDIKKPRALQILNHLLTLCNPQKPEVWIDQGLLGNKLGLHRDTVGRWVRYLVKAGSLISLGYYKDGRRMRYKINLPNLEELSSHPLESSSKTKRGKTDVFVGRPPALSSDDIRQIDRTINKENITRIKEQTVVEDFLKKKFSSNEKIALKQKMKTMGVHKQAIEKLLAKHSPDKIDGQIKHLAQLLSKGENIAKPGAWLVAAIENNYDLPNERDKKALADEQQAERIRQAGILAQRAKSELIEGHNETAKQTALKSLEISSNDLAKEVSEEAAKRIERNERIIQVRAQADPAFVEKLRLEAEQEKILELKRWFHTEAKIRGTRLFQESVEEMINQRLLSLLPF